MSGTTGVQMSGVQMSTASGGVSPPRQAWKVDDLAEDFGVSKKAIYQAIDERRLYAVRVGRSYLIPQWSVDQLLGKDAA